MDPAEVGFILHKSEICKYGLYRACKNEEDEKRERCCRKCIEEGIQVAGTSSKVPESSMNKIEKNKQHAVKTSKNAGSCKAKKREECGNICEVIVKCRMR